jgi:Protein of unknown function (DUF3011)
MRTSTLLTATAVTMAQLAPTPLLAQSNMPMTRPMPVGEQVVNRPNRPVINNTNTSTANNSNWNGPTFRCESRDNRRRNCSADTRGGVRLVRQLSGSAICREGRTWGSDNDSVWVDNGCRGEFQQRFGGLPNINSNNDTSSNGPSAGAIIGGVAVAGGLIFLLSKSSKSSKPAPATGTAQPSPQPGVQPTSPTPVLPAPPGGPAKISASTGGVMPDARPALNMCLNDAARQVGATGGSEIRLDRIDDVQAGNGGYRFRFPLVAIYPDQSRTIPTYCRATPTQVVELTFG